MKNKNSFTLRKVLRLARNTGTRDDLHLPFNSDNKENPGRRTKVTRQFLRREHKKLREHRYYTNQLTALYALCAISVWQWGRHVAVLLLFSLLSAALTDYICCRLSGKTYSVRDKSTLCAGLCTGLMLPWNISPGIAVLGAALAISVKHIFGGRRAYIFSPTAVAACFLIICYPAAMLLYAPPPPTAPSVAVTEYLTRTEQSEPPPVTEPVTTVSVTDTTVTDGHPGHPGRPGHPTSIMEYLTGQFLGVTGTVHLLIILVCGIVLLLRRAVSLSATAGIILSSLAVTEIFRLTVSDVSFAARYFVSGGGHSGAAGAYFPFAVVFLLSDPQILPKSRLGRAYYGACAGICEAAFFYFGKTGGSVLFALLIADILALQCDTFAAYSRKFAAKLSVMLHRRVHSFEHVREVSAQQTSGEPALPYSLPDITRELDLKLLRYDMPPIQGKVTKVTRKKYVLSHFVSKTVKKLGKFLRGRRKTVKNAVPARRVRHNHMGVIMPYMQDGVRVAYSRVRSRVLTLLRIRPRLTPIEEATENMLKTEQHKTDVPTIKEKLLGSINKFKAFVSETGKQHQDTTKAELRAGRAAKRGKDGSKAPRVTRRVRRRIPKCKDRRKSRTHNTHNTHNKGRKRNKE